MTSDRAIRLRVEVLDRLYREINAGFLDPRRPREVGGLLLGTVDEDWESIESIEPVEGDTNPKTGAYTIDDSTRERMAEAIRRHRATDSPLLILGYYRSHIRPNVAPDYRDQWLLKTCFTAPGSLCLLIEPSATERFTGVVFSIVAGRMQRHPATLEFPQRSAGPARAAAQASAVQASGNASGTPPETPVAAAADQYLRVPEAARRIPSQGKWLLAGLALVLAGVAAWVGLRPRPKQRPESTQEPAPAVIVERPRLGLAVARNGDVWHVTWNRELASEATRGMLTVESASSGRRSMALYAPQLKSGSLLYPLAADQVQFRLTVVEAGGAELSESVLAISGRAPPPPRVVKPPARSETARRESVRNDVPRNPPAPQIAPPRRPLTEFVAPKRTSEPAEAPKVDAPPEIDAGPATPPAVPREEPRAQSPPVERAQPAAPAEPALVTRPKPSSAKASAPVTIVPPRAIQTVAPVLPREVRTLLYEAVVVSVRIETDATGGVVRAEPISEPGRLRPFLEKASVDAARLWRFAPARMGDEFVRGELVVQFKFGPTGRR